MNLPAPEDAEDHQGQAPLNQILAAAVDLDLATLPTATLIFHSLVAIPW